MHHLYLHLIKLSLFMVLVLNQTSYAAEKRPLDLAGYQLASGAITVAHQGQFIDPYFAIRALLSADAAGMDIRNTALAYINWQLPRQEQNGLFKRYCNPETADAPALGPDQEPDWIACKEADADDALLAMWIALLYRMAPDQGLPPTWKTSILKARHQLTHIYDKKRGIYLIADNNRVGLLMDNIEIYAALRTIATHQKRLKLPQLAQQTQHQANQLQQSIRKVFLPKNQTVFRVSTQAPEPERFYPEQVAQIFAPLFDLPIGTLSTRQSGAKIMKKWLSDYGQAWLSFQQDDFPWGLVALAAHQHGAPEAAQTWVINSAPLRHTARWNVVEEVAYQVLYTANPTN